MRVNHRPFVTPLPPAAGRLVLPLATAGHPPPQPAGRLLIPLATGRPPTTAGRRAGHRRL